MKSLILTLFQTTNFRLFHTERVCRRQFLSLMGMVESSPKGYKSLWEKEKLLNTSNFSFSCCVVKRLILQKHKNQGLVLVWERVKLLPDDKISDRSKLKQSADDNFKFDENSRKFSKLVENTVGKGEIACYEQFLLYPQCFQKACLPRASKGVIVWEWVKVMYICAENFSKTRTLWKTVQNKEDFHSCILTSC